jgi:hypothetical protein
MNSSNSREQRNRLARRNKEICKIFNSGHQELIIRDLGKSVQDYKSQNNRR